MCVSLQKSRQDFDFFLQKTWNLLTTVNEPDCWGHTGPAHHLFLLIRRKTLMRHSGVIYNAAIYGSWSIPFLPTGMQFVLLTCKKVISLGKVSKIETPKFNYVDL